MSYRSPLRRFPRQWFLRRNNFIIHTDVSKLKLIRSISLALALAAALFSAAPVWAVTGADILNGTILEGVECARIGAETPTSVAGQSGTKYNVAPQCNICDFVQVFVNASNLIVRVSGAIAILIFVYAGLMYLTISFSPGNLEKAKNSLKAAIIGLAFIFGAYTIMNFIIIAFVGGESSMGGFYSMVGKQQQNWGVCETSSFNK